MINKKIVTIIGARPQFVKAALISKAFASLSDIDEVIVHTGQHFDQEMSASFFEQLEIPNPKYNLNIHSLPRNEMVRKMSAGIKNVLLQENPDLILLYGDTNSTYAGAWASNELNIPMAHVEAGVRSFDDSMPEEINRVFVDSVSALLFAPSDSASEYLKNNVSGKVVVTGDVMKDTMEYYQKHGRKPNFEIPQRFVLVTFHRQSNTNNREVLGQIMTALNEINKDISVVLPLHPRTKKALDKFNIMSGFKMVEPVGYLEMLYLLKKSAFVITDSGGLQKEAYYSKKTSLILRDKTEWIELVNNGYSQLCDPVSTENILMSFSEIKNSNVSFDKKLYGDGNSVSRIVNSIRAFFYE